MAEDKPQSKEQPRLAKILDAYTRVIGVEKKKLQATHERLLELQAEVEELATGVSDADDALGDSVTYLESAHEELRKVLYPEVEEDEDGEGPRTYNTPPVHFDIGDAYLDDGTNTANGQPGWRQYNGEEWEDSNSTLTEAEDAKIDERLVEVTALPPITPSGP